MNFPTIVYKRKGPHARNGGTFDYRGAEDQDTYDRLKSEGWLDSLAEPAENATDDAAPNRAEIEAKANELGIKFDGRTTDAKLLTRIDEELKKA